jgi:hypothetical protein
MGRTGARAYGFSADGTGGWFHLNVPKPSDHVKDEVVKVTVFNHRYLSILTIMNE